MIIMTDEEKLSTLAILVGGKTTQGRHKLTSANQLTEQDQVTTTWIDEENYTILEMTERE